MNCCTYAGSKCVKDNMANNRNIKSPPVMRDGLSYGDWKDDLLIWSDVTDLDAEKQAGAVFLSLMGKAQASVRAGVTREEMKKKDGLTKLVTCLNGLYEKDAAHSGYTAYEDFTEFKRPSSMSTEDYIIEFTIRYNKIKSSQMTLPDGVLAYYVLKCANLTEEQVNICKATCDTLTFEAMKKQIERVTSSAAKNTKETIASTPFYSGAAYDEEYQDESYDENPDEYDGEQECDQSTETAYYSHPSTSRGGRPFRPPPNGPRINAPDNYGNPSRCSFCQSIYHYRGACPDAIRASASKPRGDINRRGAPSGRFQRGGPSGRFQRGGRGAGYYI